MEVGGIFHINHLENWQGGFSTGPGLQYRHPKKKEAEDNSTPEETPEGVTQDESGVVHVDVVA
jgi:hypothetical protein